MKVELIDSMGTDLSVVNAARVSFNKESLLLNEKDEKLIGYLAKHKHWTPFAHTSISLRIKAPIFVARQLVKHQIGGVWNEVSRRYISDEPELYWPDIWRLRTDDVKQGSSEEDYLFPPYVFRNLESTMEKIVELYNELIKTGLCPEQARMILPQSTYTEWIWTGSLYFFARVCNLRLDGHAQKETQEIAQEISKVCRNLFPVSWKALVSN